MPSLPGVTVAVDHKLQGNDDAAAFDCRSQDVDAETLRELHDEVEQFQRRVTAVAKRRGGMAVLVGTELVGKVTDATRELHAGGFWPF